MTDTKPVDHARQQARAQLASITDMVREIEKAKSDEDREEAIQTINDDPLEINVRTGWYNPCSSNEKGVPEEYTLLLCTGGPACRIIGRLNEHYEPETARIEYQDWGTPWTNYRLNKKQEQTVLRYCQQFYFGE